jgi:hypothetical protein
MRETGLAVVSREHSGDASQPELDMSASCCDGSRSRAFTSTHVLVDSSWVISSHGKENSTLTSNGDAAMSDQGRGLRARYSVCSELYWNRA